MDEGSEDEEEGEEALGTPTSDPGPPSPESVPTLLDLRYEEAGEGTLPPPIPGGGRTGRLGIHGARSSPRTPAPWVRSTARISVMPRFPGLEYSGRKFAVREILQVLVLAEMEEF